MTADELFDAIKAGQREVVQNALQAEPTLANARNAAGLSGVLLALYYGQGEIAQVFQTAGAELNLFEACAAGDVARAASLLDVDPTAITTYSFDGFTPLHLACFFGHAELVELLVARGAAVNALSHNGAQLLPIHSAAAHHRPAIATRMVQHLIANGATVNDKQRDGFAPLHAAAQTGNLELAQVLLAGGAEVNVRKDDGQTPLGMALEHQHTALADYLRGQGGVAE